jgi:hypothetical protein
VTRNLDGTGANAWNAGDALFNTGQAGAGFIDLYSVRGTKSTNQAGPTIAMNVRNSATFNDWSEHAVLGNLKGLYGYGVNTYGVAVGKYSPTTSWLAADATNGIRVMRGDTQLAQWDTNGTIKLGQANNIILQPNGQASFTTAAGNLAIDDNGLFLVHGANTFNKIRWGNTSGAGYSFDYASIYAVASADEGRLLLQARNTGTFKGSSAILEAYANESITGVQRQAYLSVRGAYYSGTSGSSHDSYIELNAPDIYLQPRANETARTHGVGIGYSVGTTVPYMLAVNGTTASNFGYFAPGFSSLPFAPEISYGIQNTSTGGAWARAFGFVGLAR